MYKTGPLHLKTIALASLVSNFMGEFPTGSLSANNPGLNNHGHFKEGRRSRMSNKNVSVGHRKRNKASRNRAKQARKRNRR